MSPRLDRAPLIPVSLGAVAHPGAELMEKVGRGAYVLADAWSELFSEGRLRTRAHAVADRLQHPRAAFAGVSAAALHTLPLYRVRYDRTVMIVPGENARHSSGDIVRHHFPLLEDDVVIIDGLRVTNLDRTVYDVIRYVSMEAAVAVFDAALRQVAWNDQLRGYDVEAAERFRARVRRRVFANPGARGIRQARFVTDFADGRAQLPGESISRLWMQQLGVPAPELQYRVDLPGGRFALLDFAWPGLRRWAEFDGEMKYTDPQMLAGRSRDEVLVAQEERQDAVASVTGWRCDRWGPETMEFATFVTHLRELGLLGLAWF